MEVRLNFLDESVCHTTDRLLVGECLQVCARQCENFELSLEITMQSSREVFDTLNADYLAVHKTKEDLFWATYMATSNDDAGFAQA